MFDKANDSFKFDDNPLSFGFLDSALNICGEAVTIVNSNQKIIYLNKMAETLYGVKIEEAVGKDINNYFDNLVITWVIKTGKPVLESFHEARPGTYVLINSTPVIENEEIVGGISVERDITEMVNLNLELIKKNSELNILKQEIHKISETKADPFSPIYGHSLQLTDKIDIARRVAKTNASVLITGESGTGKELFARAIHNASFRKSKPFIPINCSAIPHNLFESELFGYEEGAFTGAKKTGNFGKFELANGGTLFLDEISEMDFSMQAKLLRVLQDNVFYKVGGQKPINVDVRIISATNKSLEKLINQGEFREDLFYRLNVVNIEVPPLRNRKGDIPELIYLFINELCKIHGKQIREVSPEVMTRLLKYNWPGNVRELKNLIERLVVLTEGESITEDFLPTSIFEYDKLQNGKDLIDDATQTIERKMIIKSIQYANGNKNKAAKSLGIPRSTLYYKMKKLKIKPSEL